MFSYFYIIIGAVNIIVQHAGSLCGWKDMFYCYNKLFTKINSKQCFYFNWTA